MVPTELALNVLGKMTMLTCTSEWGTLLDRIPIGATTTIEPSDVITPHTA